MTAADVLIAGAGPAGSALAIQLARCGLAVTLFDRAEFPREKPCGEGLMPAGVAALGRLGVDVAGHAFDGVRYRSGAVCVAGRFPDEQRGLGIRRRELDEALWATARGESLVNCVRAAVDAPAVDAAGRVIGLTAAGVEYRAPLTVGADGAASGLRRRLGWDVAQSTMRRASRFGVRRHYRLAQGKTPSSWVDIFLGAGLEAYLTPLRNREVGLAILSDQPGVSAMELFRRVQAEHSALRDLLDGAEPITAPMGASPLAVRATRRAAPGVVLLGDAAGNCDPITGGGLSQALEAAELLAASLRGRFPPAPGQLEEFDRAREAMLADYRRLTAIVLRLFRYRPSAAASLHVLAAWPALFSHLVGVAGGSRRLLGGARWRTRSAA